MDKNLNEENKKLRLAHEEIIRKYEEIIGPKPEWVNFAEHDERLLFARLAWGGAAAISKEALNDST